MPEAKCKSETDISTTFLMHLICVPVVSRGSNHNNKGAAVLKEGGNPENSKEHVKGHEFDIWFPFNFFHLRNVFTWRNMVH